jgi:hypothetical protein
LVKGLIGGQGASHGDHLSVEENIRLRNSEGVGNRGIENHGTPCEESRGNGTVLYKLLALQPLKVLYQVDIGVRNLMVMQSDDGQKTFAGRV